MKLIEIAPSGHSCPCQGLGLTNLAPEGSVFSTDVSDVSFSLLANPMEELSTCEAACLAVGLPVKEETAKPSPLPTEQLCYYSLHDKRSSVTVGARGLWDGGIQAG